MRLIDLQRSSGGAGCGGGGSSRTWRSWPPAPAGQIGCREKIAFLRHYLGVRKLRPADKRLVRSILRKQRWIERRARRKA